MEVFIIGRKRKEVGTRLIDQYKTVIVQIPNDIYELISKKGVPSKVVLEDLKNIYKK